MGKVPAFMTKEAMRDGRKIFATPYEGSPLPQDLRDMGERQLNEVLDYYIGLPLRELRTRQNWNSQYIDSVNEQVNREGWTGRLEGALRNLQIDSEILGCAVGFQTWPDTRTPIRWGDPEDGEEGWVYTRYSV